MNSLSSNLPVGNLCKTSETRKEAPKLENLLEFFLCCRTDACSSDQNADSGADAGAVSSYDVGG